MFELKRIITFANQKIRANKRLVIASIYKTKGSSYRKKWTQMIVAEDLEYAGNLSGGCVEKAVLVESEKVFKSGKNLTFEYDGQYKLGCKGSILIALELIEPMKFVALNEQIEICERERIAFIQGFEYGTNNEVGSYFEFRGLSIHFSNIANLSVAIKSPDTRFIKPQKQLIIVGSEFDSEILAKLAEQVGFAVSLVVNRSYPISDKQSYNVFHAEPDTLLDKIDFDKRTALILMTHSFARDLSFLKEVLNVDVKYFGILGPTKRKEELLENLFEHFSETNLELIDKLEKIKSPIGLDIGSKIPEEIAISLLAELIQVFCK